MFATPVFSIEPIRTVYELVAAVNRVKERETIEVAAGFTRG